MDPLLLNTITLRINPKYPYHITSEIVIVNAHECIWIK